MAYAVRADVHAKWPLTSPMVETRADALLAEANALLGRELPDLAANITAGTVDTVLARMVVTNAVIRVLVNPAGVSMQTLGPESVQYAGVRTLGAVAFTDDELKLLTPDDPDGPVSAGGSAIGSASLAFPWAPIGVGQWTV
jgi:hypothetical protein